MTLVLVLAVFVTLGAALFVATRAATPSIAAEAEAGTIAAPASSVSDSSASGGAAVRFAPSTSTGCSGAQYTPGGSDGQGGCFPDASSTGTPSGTTLVNYTGPSSITANGTVIDGKRITTQLTINASNVIIRNSRVENPGYYGVLTYGANLTVEDTTFIGGNTAALTAYEGGSFTARRINVSGSEDGVRLANNSKLYDSFIHDLEGDASSHFDSVTADGYRGWEIVHNTILNDHDQTAAVWIGDPRYAASEGLLNNNLLAGGGYTIYAGPGTEQGLRVTNNIFSRMYYPKVGNFGLIASWTSANNTWANNKYNDGTIANP